MNHLKQIAAKLPDYHLDALLVTSESGEYYATGFHGEGYVLITPNKNYYTTDSRYIEAAAAIENVDMTMINAGKSHLELAVEHVRPTGSRTLGIEEGYMSVADYETHPLPPCPEAWSWSAPRSSSPICGPRRMRRSWAICAEPRPAPTRPLPRS